MLPKGQKVNLGYVYKIVLLEQTNRPNQNFRANQSITIIFWFKIIDDFFKIHALFRVPNSQYTRF